MGVAGYLHTYANKHSAAYQDHAPQEEGKEVVFSNV